MDHNVPDRSFDVGVLSGQINGVSEQLNRVLSKQDELVSSLNNHRLHVEERMNAHQASDDTAHAEQRAHTIAVGVRVDSLEKKVDAFIGRLDEMETTFTRGWPRLEKLALRIITPVFVTLYSDHVTGAHGHNWVTSLFK